MEWLIIFNIVFAAICFQSADAFEPYSGSWWFCLFGSAINFVVAIDQISNILYAGTL